MAPISDRERGSVQLALALWVVCASLTVWPVLAAPPQEETASAEAAGAEKKPNAEETPQSAQGEMAAAPDDEQQEAEPSEEKSRQTITEQNGTLGYSRTEEIEKKKTADGEIETRRVRASGYPGDRRVLFENETRTRKLPDGSIVREYILRNPDGAGRMMPIEIIREKVRQSGDATTTERETLRPDASGKWAPLRKEQISETGDEKARKSIREVRERTLAGDWKVVDRTITSENLTEAGKASRSVRQRPNAYGELSDYEVREESTRLEDGRETTEVNLRRRDPQDTHNPKFFLVERRRTVEAKSADGKVTRKSITESDLTDQGATRSITPGESKTVEEKVEEESTAPDGTVRRVVSVKERGAVMRELRPAGQVVLEKDSKGNVRQVLIPSR
jgi:hypothetical protein